MATSRLGTALNALSTAINNAYNNAGITVPNQVGIGWPNFEDLTKIIKANQAQITLYCDKSGNRNTTRFFPQQMVKTPLNVLLTADEYGNTVTFGGSIPTTGYPYNIHTLVGQPLADAYVQTAYGDTPDSVAAKVAAAITALDLPGISASAVDNVMTVDGTANLLCNVGGSATFAQEVLRIDRLVQVSVWAADPDIRDEIEDAIMSQVGTIISSAQRLPMGDGTTTWVRYASNMPSDERELDFSMYVSHIMYKMEYGMLATEQATQIGAFRVTPVINGATIPNVIEG